MLDLRSGELRQVTRNPANEYGPAWSPASDDLAYVSDRQGAPGVYAVDPDGRERLLAAVKGTGNAPAWTPDGAAVVYNLVAQDQSRLLRGEQPLVTGEDVFPFRVQWLSASEFLYTADGQIKRRAMDGGRARPVEFTARVSFARPAYERKQPDLDGTQPQPAKGMVAPVISPDASQVAFIALGDLWVMPIGGAPRRLTDDAFVDEDPAWSPDGRSLVFSSDRAGTLDLWMHDLATGAERRLTQLPTAETGAAWSPDASSVAFLNNAGEVQIVEVATGQVRSLHKDRTAPTLFRPGRPTWSADGKTIAITALRPYSTRFREGTSQIVLLSVETGNARVIAPLPHTSIGKREDDGPVWSRDGSKLAFVAGGRLCVLPVTPGGDPLGPLRELSDGVADVPSWTGDSRRLLYVASDRLRLVDIDDGAVTEVPVDLQWRRELHRGRTVVHAGRLFDGRSKALRPDVDIVIEGDRIRAVQPHSAAAHTGRVIDASNRTVMPGLIESHTHLSDDYGEALGRIWLSYGVLTLREPAGNPYRGLERREAIESGRRIGPRIFTTGYTFDGGRIYYSGSMSIVGGPQVEKELDRARDLGYDLVKTYVRLPDNLQKRVVELAHRRGLPVTSHELYPAVAFGADGVEHIRGTSRRGYSPKVSALNESYRDVTSLLGASGMTLTPTVGIGGAFQWIAGLDSGLLADPRFTTLFPSWIVESTRKSVEGARGDLPAREARLRGYGRTVRAVTDAGGRVIAGTDAPIIPFAMSLHAEIEAYVRGGLSPYEALQTATVNAAEALGAGASLGSIEPGKLADLVIVEGDPLTDIRAARAVRMVVKGGQPLALEELLARPR